MKKGNTNLILIISPGVEFLPVAHFRVKFLIKVYIRNLSICRKVLVYSKDDLLFITGE